jgi:protein TonB
MAKMLMSAVISAISEMPVKRSHLRAGCKAWLLAVTLASGLAGQAGLAIGAPRPDLRSYFQSGFDDTKYQKACVDAVLKTWKSPAHWPRPGRKAVVQSVIGRDGKLVNARLTMESGSVEWDRAALETIKASRFPPLPKTYGEPSLQVHWHFSVVP